MRKEHSYKMKRILSRILVLLLLVMSLTASSEETAGLQDGYYTAQAADFNFGWKEYITIMVKEYNAENPSGFIKSWE